jgi:hypothetical protein
MRNKRVILLLPLSIGLGAVGALSSACGGSSSGGSGDPDCFDYSSFNAGATVSFKTQVLPIFRTSCGLSTVCHGSRTPALPGQHFYGPPLSEGPTVSDADIMLIRTGAVGANSVDEPDMQIINPTKPAESFMMYKLDGDPTTMPTGVTCSMLKCVATQTCGTGMPQSGQQLPPADRNTIRSWIAQGAPNN